MYIDGGKTTPETVATLKRTIETLMEKGAIVRNLENLGEKPLPYKMFKHSQRHTQGGYFLVDFYAPPTILPSMADHLSRDIDVVRQTILKHEEEKTLDRPCEGIFQATNLEAKFSRRKKK
ncbi:small ribosomal subunit protein bS6m isoform X2 [Pseudophryne corroboree]|uniref:small ribosomal subunit protein bS6m isoform X2 n=1 Tax=Pseudophryne corroboree TaxID=495146 RepID=UPI0030821C55